MKHFQRRPHHPTGKSSFNDIYDQPHAGPYYRALAPLDYQAPHHAQPIFRRLAAAVARHRGVAQPTVLDLCAGYGVNAALMNHEVRLKDLYEHYLALPDEAPLDLLISRDRRYFADARRRPAVARVIAQDVAGQALAYARKAGIVDDTLQVDFERDDVPDEALELVRRADLITVTGGLSYIGPETFGRILSAFPRHRKPWVALFPLSHLPMDGLSALFAEFGLTTEIWTAYAFPHRRYRNDRERDRLAARFRNRHARIETPPADDHLEAVFHLARPRAELSAPPLSALVEGPGPDAGSRVRRRLPPAPLEIAR